MDMDFLAFMEDSKDSIKLFDSPNPCFMEETKEDLQFLDVPQPGGSNDDANLFENQPSNVGPIRSNSISGRRHQRNQSARAEAGVSSAQLDITPSTSLPPQHPQQSKGSAVPHALKRGGRRSSKTVDPLTKLERSRQSARECRARKKLRYQYLEDLVKSREQAVFVVRKELEQIRQWVHEMDETGKPPEGLLKFLEEDIKKSKQKSQTQHISMDTLSVE